jgi:hypothetical protein
MLVLTGLALALALLLRFDHYAQANASWILFADSLVGYLVLRCIVSSMASAAPTPPAPLSARPARRCSD